MARPRAYNHDVRCPHCGSTWAPKDGHSKGKQTYRCGDCLYRFTPDGNRHYYPAMTIRQALSMYSEGGSVSANILPCSIRHQPKFCGILPPVAAL